MFFLFNNFGLIHYRDNKFKTSMKGTCQGPQIFNLDKLSKHRQMVFVSGFNKNLISLSW